MSEATLKKPAAPHWPLAGKTARDLMTPNPVSIESTATVPEVLAFLTDTGYSAAPVIDEAGQIGSLFPKVKVHGHVPEVLEALTAAAR